jgi:hypothetical protein
MELELYRCNPFFTKNGDYTFEIEIDLKDPKNRRIYQHINRMDVTKRPENRTALMICDGEKVIEGTEIVLSMDENKVDIQLVADNSDINYLMGDDESIRDFDLGEVAMTREEANAAIEKYYPESPVAICPVRNKFIESTAISAKNTNNFFPPSSYGAQTMHASSEPNPQPYVLYILEKVIESLGYKVGYNQLTQTELFCRVFFLNSYKDKPFNKMAPDMTREDFIEECEKFFNCVLSADSIRKVVNIYNVNTFYDNKPKTYITEVMEEFKKEYDNEDTVNMNYTNVAYGSNYSNIYRRAKKEVVDKCETVEWDEFETLVEKSFSEEYYNKFYIHRVKGDEIEYIPYKKDLDNGLHYRAEVVFNRMGDIVDEEAEDEDKVELGFIPANTANLTVDGAMSEFVRDIDTTSTEDEDEEEQTLLDALENGLEEEETPSFFQIAINAGVQPCWDRFGKAVAGKYSVQSWIDGAGYSESSYFSGSTGVPYRSHIHANDSLTLALKGEKGLYERVYSKNKKVNTKVKYTISFITNRILDPKTIFVINNKEYYCKQLKYTIHANGKSKVCEGEFYAVGEDSF